MMEKLAVSESVNVEALEQSAEVLSLLLERVDAYKRSIRSRSKVYAGFCTFLGFSAFLPYITSLLVRQDFSGGLVSKLVISLLNLVVFLGFGLVGYLVFYRFIRLLLSFDAFSKGEYYQRSIDSYQVLSYKAVNAYYTTFYFSINGTVSSVKVSNSYGSLFEVGSRVPVKVESIFFKHSDKVRVVRSCVGSRESNGDALMESIKKHNLSLESKGIEVPVITLGNGVSSYIGG